jgi:serine phosphatase RsbU (regulator of sigma subunit)
VLDYLLAAGMILGVVHGSRIEVLAHPAVGVPLPVFERPGVEESLPLARTVATQRPQFVHSPAQFRSEYPTLWADVEPFPIGAGAYLPLVAQGRIMGVLAVLYRRAREFSQHERNLLVTLGSSIAQSLQRAMLSGQEHDLAESLQQAMLPRRIPGVPGADIAVRYRSARLGRSVGGDWYDVIPLPGDRVGVAVGDVQGHDTEAAAVMGQLRVVLSAYVAEGHPPATAMARASAFLQELDTDRFATCTYVQANLATGGLHVVRAGHLDVLVRARDGTCRWVGSEGGLPLGLSAEFSGPGAIDYPVTRLTLLPGETLLMFTDGLVELPGADLGQRMSVLSDAVGSGPVEVDALADRLVDVVGAQNAGDDMALLLMRRMGLASVREAA